MRAILFIILFFTNFCSGADFKPFFNHVVKVEGSAFTVTRFDRGGATKFGVTFQTFNRFCDLEKFVIECDKDNDKKVTPKDLARLALNDVKPIYKTYYWNVVKGDKIHNQAIAEFLTDFVVNSGASKNKVLQLQKAMGIKQDGIFGTQTIKAINKQNPKVLFKKLYSFRVNFYKKICANDRTQLKFFKGWINRISLLEQIYYHEKFI
ncbi:glycoside hydrolase family 108 protein [Arcicella lustrica]|uniref:Glycosyl hydrolase 108 family protein n=1 Tax=Arcicella lustrica TaxID=2984196 RepID=A0ABU5SHN8_9BACT|nr:glycosyl hydrolase 108 family protein [Arcicella sp. DC25W]MEA5426803.1 glycosyl hydrolase 108 family protein [Arcicella sp. DC25W]